MAAPDSLNQLINLLSNLLLLINIKFVKYATHEMRVVKIAELTIHVGRLMESLKPKWLHDVDLDLIRPTVTSLFEYSRSYLRLHKPRRSLGFLFWGLILLKFSASYSNITIKPQNTIVAVGNPATFTCETNIRHYYPQWMISAARQPYTDTVYDESLKESYTGKLSVVSKDNESVIVTELTFFNVTMQDAGMVFCREDGDFGKTVTAKLSVVNVSGYSATCTNNYLVTTWSMCYWSEDTLYPILRYEGNIKPNISTETFNSEQYCMQIEAIWIIQRHCNTLDISDVLIFVSDTTEETEWTKFNKSVEVLRPGLHTTSANVLNEKTTNPTNIDSTELHKPTPEDPCILPIVLAMVIWMVAVFVLSVVRHLYLKKKRNSLQLKNFRENEPEENPARRLNPDQAVPRITKRYTSVSEFIVDSVLSTMTNDITELDELREQKNFHNYQ